MISDSKLISYYDRATEEFGHPDPDKGIFGRAQLAGRNPEYEKGDRVGLFGVSKKRAEAAGWTDLKNPEQNFRAAMDLDVSSYNTGELAEMYISTAGVTGGEQKKLNFITQLDSAYQEISSEINYEGGRPVSISGQKEDTQSEEMIDDSSGKEGMNESVKRGSALLQNQTIRSTLDSGQLDRDVDSALSLLKEYIDKSIQ